MAAPLGSRAVGKKIRVGILGAGAMGAVHASAYAGLSDKVEPVGVFSRIG